jgi:hypothetical protein
MEAALAKLPNMAQEGLIQNWKPNFLAKCKEVIDKKVIICPMHRRRGYEIFPGYGQH